MSLNVKINKLQHFSYCAYCACVLILCIRNKVDTYSAPHANQIQSTHIYDTIDSILYNVLSQHLLNLINISQSRDRPLPKITRTPFGRYTNNSRTFRKLSRTIPKMSRTLPTNSRTLSEDNPNPSEESPTISEDIPNPSKDGRHLKPFRKRRHLEFLIHLLIGRNLWRPSWIC